MRAGAQHAPWRLPVTTFTSPLGSLSRFATQSDPMSNSSPRHAGARHHSRHLKRDILASARQVQVKAKAPAGQKEVIHL